jgi:microcystin-dependent protein
MPSGRSAAPNGFLFCDGSQISRNVYAALYAAIGTLYGPGDGSTTFNVPDLRGRTPIGAGAGPSLTNRALGAVGGEESHTLVTAEMPYHNHTLTDDGHSHPVNDPPHSHSVSQYPHNHTLHDPQHQHGYIFGNTGAAVGLGQEAFPGGYNNFFGWTTSASTNISLDPANANISIVANQSGVTIAGAYSSIKIAATGGNGPHNNMQPYIAINYFIKT